MLPNTFAGHISKMTKDADQDYMLKKESFCYSSLEGDST
jgi:hypothetical protein